jgi:hypothetical protein
MLVLAQARDNGVVGSSARAAWLISATAPTVPRIWTQRPPYGAEDPAIQRWHARRA